MAPKRLDNLLPAGAGERHEADYPCFAVTPEIMYHLDGSTANTAWDLARPFALHLFLCMSSSAGGWPMAACFCTPASGFLLLNTPQLLLLLCRVKGKGFRQAIVTSPVGTSAIFHEGGRSGKENSSINLSGFPVCAPQTCRYCGHIASRLRTEVSHW